jgi:NAD(P)-dependent dehydrogenase (short-subunit alcohol dehydrogenase family)
VSSDLSDLFGLEGRVAVVTGASGVLGSAVARGLAAAGAAVAILARTAERCQRLAAELQAAGHEAVSVPADVVELAQLERAREAVLARWGRVDILVNAAGGNLAEATVGDRSFFQLAPEAIDAVVALNLRGTLLASRVFGEPMLEQPAPPGGRSIVNVSSMAAGRAITRVVGYAAAKAAVENFTRWLAVDLSRSAPGRVRVNAIAPGFFVGEQNRELLLGPDGTPTERGATIIARTPAGRFGTPEEIVGTVVWLCSPAAGFVNGVVVPIDGGFDAYSGV